MKQSPPKPQPGWRPPTRRAFAQMIAAAAAAIALRDKRPARDLPIWIGHF